MKLYMPIAVKIALVVSALMALTIGAVIGVSFLTLRKDIRISTQNDINELNSVAAFCAEEELATIRSNTYAVLSLTAAAPQTTALPALFWEQNPSIAAFVIPDSAVYVNETWTRFNEIDSSFIHAYMRLHQAVLYRSNEKDTILINASESFKNVPVLVMRLSAHSFARQINTPFVFVIFSGERLRDAFSSGAYSSVLVNDNNEILISTGGPAVGGTVGIGGIGRAASAFTVSTDGAAAGNDVSLSTLTQNSLSVKSGVPTGACHIVTFIQKNTAFEVINETVKRNIYLSITVWGILLLILWIFSRNLTAQLLALRHAAEEIEDGSYNINLPVRNHDETGKLTESFNSLGIALGNFECFTNRVVAKLAYRGRLKSGGAFKRASILFSDIRSFTALSESLSPEGIVTLINNYMEYTASCALASGGIIDKYIGDAIMANWGAGSTAGSEEEDALAACRAALMMRAALGCFNKTRKGMPPIKIGCAINTGTVVAGRIGSEERLEFALAGANVRLADTLETYNKPYGTDIVISGETWRLTRQYIIAEEMPTIPFSEKKVRVFALINMKDESQIAKMFEELSTIRHIDTDLCGHFIGENGPATLQTLRRLLDIPTPDLTAGYIPTAKIQ
ncbi:MAG: HAMP domain-containing protein [Spirochaetaceae bacterium]|jgi:adenylate cyclase|nr:HAMP domain-containing protein [Spirochaetaceae bacterium]